MNDNWWNDILSRRGDLSDIAAGPAGQQNQPIHESRYDYVRSFSVPMPATLDSIDDTTYPITSIEGVDNDIAQFSVIVDNSRTSAVVVAYFVQGTEIVGTTNRIDWSSAQFMRGTPGAISVNQATGGTRAGQGVYITSSALNGGSVRRRRANMADVIELQNLNTTVVPHTLAVKPPGDTDRTRDAYFLDSVTAPTKIIGYRLTAGTFTRNTDLDITLSSGKGTQALTRTRLLINIDENLIYVAGMSSNRQTAFLYAYGLTDKLHHTDEDVTFCHSAGYRSVITSGHQLLLIRNNNGVDLWTLVQQDWIWTLPTASPSQRTYTISGVPAPNIGFIIGLTSSEITITGAVKGSTCLTVNRQGTLEGISQTFTVPVSRRGTAILSIPAGSYRTTTRGVRNNTLQSVSFDYDTRIAVTADLDFTWDQSIFELQVRFAFSHDISESRLAASDITLSSSNSAVTFSNASLSDPVLCGGKSVYTYTAYASNSPGRSFVATASIAAGDIDETDNYLTNALITDSSCPITQPKLRAPKMQISAVTVTGSQLSFRADWDKNIGTGVFTSADLTITSSNTGMSVGNIAVAARAGGNAQRNFIVTADITGYGTTTMHSVLRGGAVPATVSTNASVAETDPLGTYTLRAAGWTPAIRARALAADGSALPPTADGERLAEPILRAKSFIAQVVWPSGAATAAASQFCQNDMEVGAGFDHLSMSTAEAKAGSPVRQGSSNVWHVPIEVERTSTSGRAPHPWWSVLRRALSSGPRHGMHRRLQHARSRCRSRRRAQRLRFLMLLLSHGERRSVSDSMLHGRRISGQRFHVRTSRLTRLQMR